MNNQLSCDPVVGVLKRDFGSLWQCRDRGTSIEIVTPFSTSTQKFISVFITKRDGEFVVTDGGWLCNESNGYGLCDIDDISCFADISTHFCEAFKIEVKRNQDEAFYFKKIADEAFLSNAVYDVAQFVSSVVNSLSMPEQDEANQRELFRHQANRFLLDNFQNVKFGQHPLDDCKTAIFHSVIRHSSQISLVAYVTGVRNAYFVSQFQRAVVNFELAAQSKYLNHIKGRVAFINNKAAGYSPDTVAELSPLLKRYDAQPLPWTERETALAVL